MSEPMEQEAEGVRCCQILVIGGGFSGTIAACVAAEAGARVVQLDAGPGGTAFWSGLGDVFGPTRPPTPEQPGTRFRRGDSARARRIDYLDPRDRLELLEAWIPDHPFSRLGWGPPEIARRLDRALAAISWSATRYSDSPLIATGSGTVRRADVVSAGIPTPDRVPAATLVTFDALPSFDVGWATWALERSGIDVTAVDRIASDDPPASTLARFARSFDRRDPDALAQRLAEAPGAGPLICPPVLGHDAETRRSIAEALENRAGRALYELSGTHDSVFGPRVLDALRRSAADAGVATAQSRAGEPVRVDDAWEVPTIQEVWRAQTVIIAAGNRLGQTRDGGWIERWSTPEPPRTRTTRLSPWHPQPFLARGLSFDDELRVMRAGRVLRGIYAAGACLQGHDPAHDSTALGVAMTTAVEAASRAVAELGLGDDGGVRRDEPRARGSSDSMQPGRG